MRRAALLVLIALLALPQLSGCGKKPADLESPPGEASDFPRKYPR